MPELTKAKIKVAVAQATPIFLDRAGTIEKACALIEEAGREGARLVVFPEAFIPGYPDWVWAIPPGEDRLLGELYAELLANSVAIPGPEVERLGRAARKAGVFVAMGLSERNTEASGATLYNTLLYLNSNGDVIGKHRKLVPTGAERMVWAQGDGSTLEVYDTSIGRLSGLICWENYMPLARYALYAWGTQIYLAPTWNRGEPWLSTLRHIAKEGRMYVLGCCMALRKADIPDRYAFKQRFYSTAGEWINEGDSVIVDPDGNVIAGLVSRKEEILYAEINLDKTWGAKWILDVAGHYARPDVFQLTVNRTTHPILQVQEVDLEQ